MKRRALTLVLGLALLLGSAAFASADLVRFEFVGVVSGVYGGDLAAQPDVEVVFPFGSPVSVSMAWDPATPPSFMGEYLGGIRAISVSYQNYRTPLTLGAVSAFVWPESSAFNGYADAAGPAPGLFPALHPFYLDFSMQFGPGVLSGGLPPLLPDGPILGRFTLAFRDSQSPELPVFVDSAIGSVRAVPLPGTLLLVAVGLTVWGLRALGRAK